MSIGMHAATGRTLTDLEHLRQSVVQILTTPIGTRVMRRGFGSLLPELVDQPTNDYTLIRLYAATASALIQHEPRLRLDRVSIDLTEATAKILEIHGTAFLDGRHRAVSVSVPAYTGSS